MTCDPGGQVVTCARWLYGSLPIHAKCLTVIAKPLNFSVLNVLNRSFSVSFTWQRLYREDARRERTLSCTNITVVVLLDNGSHLWVNAEPRGSASETIDIGVLVVWEAKYYLRSSQQWQKEVLEMRGLTHQITCYRYSRPFAHQHLISAAAAE